MGDLAQYFAMGGWAMYPLALLALLSVAAVITLPAAAILGGKPRLAFLSGMGLIGLGILAAGVGAFGQRAGLRAMEEALSFVNPADVETIRALGAMEARVPLIFGMMISVAPLSAGAALIGYGASEGAAKPGLLVVSGVIAAVGLAALLTGSVARQIGTQQALSEAAYAAPEQKAQVVAAGNAQARARGRVGLWLGLPLMALGAALFAVGKAERAQAPGK